MRSPVVAAVAAGVLATPGLASATALSAFHTPGWAAECYVPFPHELPLSKTGITCLTPSDGFTISMGPFGRPTKTYDKNAVGYRDPFAARRLLRLGQHWAVRPYWRLLEQGNRADLLEQERPRMVARALSRLPRLLNISAADRCEGQESATSAERTHSCRRDAIG